MATEILNLEVKSDIKPVIQDINSLSVSLKQAQMLESELTAQIKVKNGVLIDLERDLIKLKATQDSMPKGEYWKGQEALNQKIKDRVTDIKLEQNALKDLKNQQRDNNAEMKTTEKTVKDITSANKAAKKPANLFRTGLRGIGTALKGMGIGLLISGLLLLKRAFQQNETVMKAVQTVTNVLSNIITDIVDAFKDVYKWVGDSSDRFDAMQQVITDLITIGLTPLKLAFHTVELGALGLMLAWNEVQAAFGSEGASESVKRLKADIIKTKIALGEVVDSAVEAGGSIVTNLGEAAGELYDIYGNLKVAIVEVAEKGVDTNKRASKKIIKTKKSEIKTIAELEAEAREKKAAADKVAQDQRDKEQALANQAAHDAIVALEEENRMGALESKIQDIESEKTFALAKLEAQRIAEEESLKEHENFLELNKELDIKYKRLAGEINNKALKDQEKVDAATLTSKLDTTKAIGGAIGALGGLLKEGSAGAKAAALAEIAINTGVGIVQGLDIAQKSAKAAGPGAAFAFPLFYAAQIASVLGAAAQAKNILGAGGGSETGGGGNTPAAPPSPQMMSGAFELGSGEEIEPARAYVLSDDITDSQNGLAVIRRRATI